MNISGTLHLYSGDDKELFFTFDDDIAQELYSNPRFKIKDKKTRKVFISVGRERFIHERTMSFSKKQSEIKVSLCKLTTKDGLGGLTRLYDWFIPSGHTRPEVIEIVGTLGRQRHRGNLVWELALQEPVGLVAPPGLNRRRKSASKARRAFDRRRKIQERQLHYIGRLAEIRALPLLEQRFRSPSFRCLWRDGYFDSEKEDIRKLGIICDIDIWNDERNKAEAFYEIKAQHVTSRQSKPLFYLANSEWRSLRAAKENKIPFRIWLVEYECLAALEQENGEIRILEFDDVLPEWVSADVLLVIPEAGSWRTIKAQLGL